MTILHLWNISNFKWTPSLGNLSTTVWHLYAGLFCFSTCSWKEITKLVTSSLFQFFKDTAETIICANNTNLYQYLEEIACLKAQVAEQPLTFSAGNKLRGLKTEVDTLCAELLKIKNRNVHLEQYLNTIFKAALLIYLIYIIYKLSD